MCWLNELNVVSFEIISFQFNGPNIEMFIDFIYSFSIMIIDPFQYNSSFVFDIIINNTLICGNVVFFSSLKSFFYISLHWTAELIADVIQQFPSSSQFVSDSLAN